MEGPVGPVMLTEQAVDFPDGLQLEEALSLLPPLEDALLVGGSLPSLGQPEPAPCAEYLRPTLMPSRPYWSARPGRMAPPRLMG
mgnify:CR=1 FL=1